MTRAASTPPPRCPRARRSEERRSAPAGGRRASGAHPRRAASLPRSGGATGRASIRSRRGVRKACLLPSLLSAPLQTHCADAISELAAGADRIDKVVGPLSTTRVSGSQTVERMPISATLRPAVSSRVVSPAGRGAGPPKRASIACCWTSVAVPAVPATGGARLKSGGMISGALRATANSSGVRLLLPWKMPHPAVERAAMIRTAPWALRMFDCLLRSLLTGQERAQQQHDDGNANSRITDVEYQKRPPPTKMQIKEVDDVAVQRAV